MRILIIDDEPNICLTLQSIFEDDDHEVSACNSGEDGLKEFEKTPFDIVFLDVRLPKINGIDVLNQLMHEVTKPLVCMISGDSGIPEAVKAIKLGAFDFLEKPLSLPRIKLTLQRCIDFLRINREYEQLTADRDSKYKMIGNSSVMQTLKTQIQKVAQTNAKVLIRGESGTGKELIAYAIHNKSLRRGKPFIKFNSAAIPSELVESELFGFERGSFTGAAKSRIGKIEEADGGTLFLDEIGDMSLSAQAKILRVIQEGEFERIGSNKTIKIDARIIAATHKNLEEMVKNGEFREDLYYRLNVVPLTSPSLRNHIDDLPEYLSYFCELFAKELNIKPKKFSNEAIEYMQTLKWAGNIRQLRNLVERLYILIDATTINKNDLVNQNMQKNSSSDLFWQTTEVFSEKRKKFEKRYIQTQLKKHECKITKTANALGLHQSNLSRKIKELDINLSED